MDLQHRPMRARDVHQCVALIGAHPVLGPRYGRVIANLRPAWLRLLECEAKSAIVFEEVEATNVEVWGIGVSVFVNDDFLRELKTPPFFWIGPELAKRTMRGDSPVLSGRQLREANSYGGLNLVVWEGYIRPGDAKMAEVSYGMMAAFIEEHSGYLWKETIAAQAGSVDHLLGLLKCGGLLLNPKDGRYTDSIQEEPQELLRQPHVIGLTRELALEQPGSWAGALFLYHPPKFRFNRSEQRLLLSAIAGGTDEELSMCLGTSLSTVKKTWLSVYSRVTACLPTLLPDHWPSDEWAVERGKEKRRRLLAYLREHPEELRPVSRKPLHRDATQLLPTSKRRSTVETSAENAARPNRSPK